MLLGLLVCLTCLDEGPAAPSFARARTLVSATTTVGGRVLVVGGLADERSLATAHGDAELLDPFAADGVGRVLDPMPLAGVLLPARAGHVAVALDGGRVLLVGGDAAGTVELYDPDLGPTGGFRRVTSLPGGPRLGLTATRLGDGTVLVTGGMSAARKQTSFASVVDVEARRARAVGRLAESRSSHTATLLADGRVLVVGGVGRATTELYDPEKGTFDAGPDLAHTRDDHCATRLADGSVLITGGQHRGRSMRTAERFRVRPDRMEELEEMDYARADHAQVTLEDGRVILLGGEVDDGEGNDLILDAVEAFEPAVGRFVTLDPLETPRDDHAAVPLSDGRIAVICGQTTGDVALRSYELYRPRRP